MNSIENKREKNGGRNQSSRLARKNRFGKCISPARLFAGLFLLMPLTAAAFPPPAEIHDAALAGKLDAVKTLVEADPSLMRLKDGGGNTPLHAAAQGGSASVAAYLIEKGAEVGATNASGDTPLHIAIFNGKYEVVVLLIDKGADLKKANAIGRTPLHHAARYGRKASVELLLSKGVPVDPRDNFQRTPLNLLTLMTEYADVARLLIQHGADINATDSNGTMPLEHAVHNGFPSMIDLLLDSGAGFRVTDGHADTMLYLSAAVGSGRMFKAVVEKAGDGLFRDAAGNANTMNAAIGGGSREIVDILLAKGIKIDPRPNLAGWTPLHQAAAAGATGLIELLVDNGVDVNARTNDGRSAYNLAEERGDRDALGLILKRGGNAEPQKFPLLTGPYLGQTPPGEEPKRFAPGIVFGGHSTVSISPDGKEMYWAADSSIMVSRLENGRWTKPSVAPFSGASQTPMYDDVPFVSPDNKRLFFTSLRPLVAGGGNKENIWYVERTPGGWSAPIPVEGEVNGLNLHWQISVSNAGTLYFAGTREGDGNGIYFSRLVDGKYARPVKAGPEINGEGQNGCPFIAPDESYLIFSRVRDGRLDGLYISFKSENGQWLPGVRFSQGQSSPTAVVSPDGKVLFTGLSWMDAGFIEKLRPKK